MLCLMTWVSSYPCPRFGPLLELCTHFRKKKACIRIWDIQSCQIPISNNIEFNSLYCDAGEPVQMGRGNSNFLFSYFLFLSFILYCSSILFFFPLFFFTTFLFFQFLEFLSLDLIFSCRWNWLTMIRGEIQGD